jgi:hypothetical protein
VHIRSAGFAGSLVVFAGDVAVSRAEAAIEAEGRDEGAGGERRFRDRGGLRLADGDGFVVQGADLAVGHRLHAGDLTACEFAPVVADHVGPMPLRPQRDMRRELNGRVRVVVLGNLLMG